VLGLPLPPGRSGTVGHRRRIAGRTGGLVLAAALFVTACGADTSSAPTSSTTSTSAPVAAPGPPGVLEVPALRLEEVVRLDRPVALATRPGSPDVFIAEQAGTIRRISVDPEEGWARDERPFLDLSSRVRAEGERGLLGIAFSPDGRALYTHFTNTEGNTVLDAWAIDTEGVVADSRRTVFTTPQPYANHNGGQIAFGPDGYLYVALGDGGGSGDPDGNAQNTSTVLGSILRLDPDGASGDATYAIPADNPVRDGGAPEVWAWGLRNPWRFSFDRATGDLWIADVGEASIEEVNFLPRTNGALAGRGANLGWPLFEGSLSRTDDAVVAATLPPIFEYTHDEGGCSVIGGYVYRGSAIDGLQGTYLFGDFCQPALRGLRVTNGAVTAEGPLGIEAPRVTAFGQDQDGEIWVLSHAGPVYRLVPG
jgi:glucose/arabinose dehydrogenase